MKSIALFKSLEKFVIERYGLRLVCLDGDFDNLIDMLKIQNADNTFTNIAEYPEVVQRIKQYKGEFCSIKFSIENRSQAYSNVFSVSFN